MLQGIKQGLFMQEPKHNVETTITFCSKEIQSNAVSKEDHVNCLLEPKGVLFVDFLAGVIL
jgi:hypothetical protein